MSGDKRTLRWCAEHQQPAWVYDDGSEWCWYDSIVEATNPHKIVNLPQDDEIVRLRAEVKGLTGERDFNERQLVAEVAEIERLRAERDAERARSCTTCLHGYVHPRHPIDEVGVRCERISVVFDASFYCSRWEARRG